MYPPVVIAKGMSSPSRELFVKLKGLSRSCLSLCPQFVEGWENVKLLFSCCSELTEYLCSLNMIPKYLM